MHKPKVASANGFAIAGFVLALLACLHPLCLALGCPLVSGAVQRNDMSLAILNLFFPFSLLFPLLAFLFSAVGLREGSERKGKPFGIVGFGLSAVCIVFWLVRLVNVFTASTAF